MKTADPFDPNTWVPDDHEYRIYASDDLSLYAIVDAIDYPYLVRWRWNAMRFHSDRRWSRKDKLYLRRGLDYREDGVRKVRTVLLHVEVMRLSGKPPPTNAHVLVGHADDDSLNCRRVNLVWVTPSENNKAMYQNGRSRKS